jgi:hypothetical protein
MDSVYDIDLSDWKEVGRPIKPPSNEGNDPSGNVYDIDLSGWKEVGAEPQAIEQAQPSEVSKPTTEESNIGAEFFKGIPRGWHSTKSTLYALAGLSANVVGAKDAARGMLTKAQEEELAGEEHPASVKSFRDISGPGDIPQYVAGLVGEQVPNIIETAATTLAGAAIGSAAEPGGGTIAGAATGLFGKQVVKGMVKAAVKKILE